jgi:hypothetical protein
MLDGHLASHPPVLTGLAGRDPVRNPLDAVVAHLLALRLAVYPLNAIGPDLLALGALLHAFGPLRPRLLAFGAHLNALGALRSGLLALGPLLDALGPLRAGLLAFGALGHALDPLRPLDGGTLGASATNGLAFGTRGFCPGRTATMLDGGRRAVLATLVATRTCRGRY